MKKRQVCPAVSFIVKGKNHGNIDYAVLAQCRSYYIDGYLSRGR